MYSTTTAPLQFGLESELGLIVITATAALVMIVATIYLLYVAFATSGWSGEETESVDTTPATDDDSGRTA